jgi:uncharacterized protein YjiS (DUF1127 family)
MSTQISRATVSPSTERIWSFPEQARWVGARLVWQWFASMAAKGVAAVGKHQRRLRAERELQDLDDRMLKDIGISRSEIDSLMRFGRGRRLPIDKELWS